MKKKFVAKFPYTQALSPLSIAITRSMCWMRLATLIFIGEVISALSVADSVVVLVNSVSGVEVGTEIAWRYAGDFKLPRFVVV